MYNLFVRVHTDEILSNHGGFVFEKVATNHLNQEHMTFARHLNFDLLSPLVDNLKGLLNLHNDICNTAQIHVNQNTTKTSRDGTQIEHHGFINGISYVVTPETSLFSPKMGKPDTSHSVCNEFSARLPEPNPSNLNAIKQLCIRHQLYKIPVAIDYKSESLVYTNTNTPISTTLFDTFSFFNDIKEVLYPTSSFSAEVKKKIVGQSLQVYLVSCDSTKPRLQFVDAHYQGNGPIICEKPNSFLQNINSDASSSFLYHWVNHACKRDHPELMNHVDHATTELEHILEYKFSPKKLLNYANYFPQITNGILSPSPNPTPATVTLLSSPSLFSQSSSFSQAPMKTSHPIRKVRHVSQVQILEPDDPQLKNSSLNLTLNETLSLLHLTNETLRNKVYVFTDSDNPTEEEIISFLLQQPLDSDSNVTFSLVRDKRSPVIYLAAAFPLAGIAVGIYYLATYIKSLFNYDLDLLALNTQPEPMATLQQLYHTHGIIVNLTIEHNTIKKAINRAQSLISSVKKDMNNHMIAIAFSSAQLDTKASIHFALQVVSSFVSKFANILLGAQAGITSIYALNKYDLMQIGNTVATNYPGISLTSKLSEVKTELLSSDKVLSLKFTIPIVTPQTLYNFYKVIPIPIFQGDVTMIPDTTFTNLAVSVSQMYYTTLSEQEFTTCIGTNPTCKTHFPMKFLSSRYDCVLAAFLDHNSTCKYKPIPVIPNPFFYFHEFQAVYSVPQATTIRTTCTDIKGSTVISNYQITSVGNLHFPPNCKIVTANSDFEFHYSTPAITETVDINNWQTFDNIKYQDIPDKSILHSYQQLNVTLLEPTILSVPTWEELLKDSVSLKKVLPTWAQVVVLGIICIGIFFLAKYLNTITCCDAVKGAYHRRLQGTSRRFANWRNKRANYFNTIKRNTSINTQPHLSSSFQDIHLSLRPIQEHAQTHAKQNTSTTFTTGIYEAQRDLEKLNYVTRLNEATLAAQSRITSANVIPEPVHISTEPKHTEKAHKYNTRSKHVVDIETEIEPTAPNYPNRHTGFQFN